MQLGLVISVITACGLCVAASPPCRLKTGPTRDAPVAKRSDKEQILDAILHDVLHNAKLKAARQFYGTPRDKEVALVWNRSSKSIRWPASYQPLLPGWTVRRVREDAKVDPTKPRLLGVRIDKYYGEDKRTADMCEAPVAVTILNAGGQANGQADGGWYAYYIPKRVGEKWVVNLDEFGRP